MITSDTHVGILNAIGKTFPTVPWQRRQFHLIRTVIDNSLKKYQAGFRAELHELFNYKSIGETCKICDRIEKITVMLLKPLLPAWMKG